MGICKKCGKKMGFLESFDAGSQGGLCRDCFSPQGSTEYEAWKAKQLSSNDVSKVKQITADLNPNAKCTSCGYCEKQIHDIINRDDLGFQYDDSYSTYKCRKFGLEINNDNKYRALRCTSYISKGDYTEKCLSGQMNNCQTNTNVILDFSALKDVITKGGIVMTAYNCPKCSGMVDIPESGKVLICKYCGTPIKPVDIFEKLKSLIITTTQLPNANSEPAPSSVKNRLLILRALKERLEKTFPSMVKLSEDEEVIWVMGKVKMTEHGVVEGSGPAAERCQKIYEKLLSEN